MCLESITKSYKRKQSGVGWKLFTYDSKKNKIGCLYRGNEDEFPVNRFVHERKYREGFLHANVEIETSQDNITNYPFGFHIFINKQDAISEHMGVNSIIVRRVEYRKGHTKGIDKTTEKLTIVATEICVGRNT